jgi:peptide/nickel transport system substrate-binding protein
MFNDPKAEELRAKAMSGSANSEERVANFIKYHEYVLSQFPFSPIYQPVVNVGYNKERIKVPEVLNAPSFQNIAIMDLEVTE